MSARLVLRNELVELGRLAAWTRDLARECGAVARDAYRLDLVLTELVTNLLMHGFAPGADGNIALEANHDGAVLSVAVEDNGPPFDPFGKQTAALPTRLEDATPGGLGLVLIRNYVDEARYARRDGRNHVTLAFHLAAPAA